MNETKFKLNFKYQNIADINDQGVSDYMYWFEENGIQHIVDNIGEDYYGRKYLIEFFWAPIDQDE